MTEAEAIALLDQLSGSDPERAHSDADAALLRLVSPAVRDAYYRVVERCAWWACA